MTDLTIDSFLVRRYRCPFCPRTASRPSRIREHAERCWLNPSVQGCKTCRNWQPPTSLDPDCCDAGVDLEGKAACETCHGFNTDCPACGGNGAEVKQGPIVRCGLWEPRP